MLIAPQDKENVGYVIREVNGKWFWVEMRGD